MAKTPARRSTDSRWNIWLKLHLSTQLFLVLVGCNIPVFVFFHIYDTRATRTQIEVLEKETLGTLTPLVTSAIEQSMVNANAEHIDKLFEILRKNESIKFAQLLDVEGRVVNTADFRAAGAVRHDAFSLPKDTLDHTSEVPVRSSPACVRCHGAQKEVLGYVRLTTTGTRVHEALLRLYAARMAMVAAGLFCLIFSSYLIVRRMVRHPMRRLLDAMAQVRRGRLDTRVPAGGSHEFSRIVGFFNSMVSDIERDRKEIMDLHRRQLAHMDRLATVGELAAHLAHEVRNPLTGIGSAIQVLMSEQTDNSPKRRILEKILGQLDRMEKTMSSFLSYTRMPEAVIRPFRIHEPLQRILPILLPRLKAQKIDIKSDVSEELPEVLGDTSQIEQVFLNLCLNAGQAMPDGGRLLISARRRGGMLRVEIADTGCGIKPEELEHIFKPFYTTREKGSGLGLPLTKQIVMAHGGALTVESVPGKGTSVFITLPLNGGGGTEAEAA